VDALAALGQFYIKFPAFATNDLYVSGESYGGIYVPYLSWQIYQNNLQAKFNPAKKTIPLKGYIVANGITDYHVDVWPSFIETVYNFNLIPKDLLNTYESNDCFVTFNNSIPHVNTLICDVAFE